MSDNFLYDNFQKENNYDIACFSDIGKRNSQQDSGYIAADDGNVIAVICDGMGGFEGGQKASSTAVDAFVEFYQCYAAEKNFNIEWMQQAAKRIDEIVYDLSDADGKRLGAGTTLIGLWIVENSLSWVSVGDSRIYILRGEEMAQITCDHNYFMEIDRKRAHGTISEEEYKKESESGEALISFVGMGGLLMMDISDNPFMLQSGDIIFACTDGVYRTINDDRLKEIISYGKSAVEKAQRIFEAVKLADKIAQDNFTGAIIRIR